MNDQNITDAPKPATENSSAVLFELSERAGTLFRKSNADALACGRVLLEARGIAKHGSWSAFLTDAGIHPRTANRLMRVAEFVGDSVAKSDFLSDLGLTRTVAFIRASERSMAAWSAARAADPANIRLILNPPECAFFGLFWCGEPEDRAILAEVAARDFEIETADVLARISQTP